MADMAVYGGKARCISTRTRLPVGHVLQMPYQICVFFSQVKQEQPGALCLSCPACCCWMTLFCAGPRCGMILPWGTIFLLSGR